MLSCYWSGIPGIKASLLEEYKVRLIAYDRPGYGQSDPHMGRNYNTSAYDIVEIADALNLGDKFWVVGFGGGGPHVWAAINYLPERLAGTFFLYCAAHDSRCRVFNSCRTSNIVTVDVTYLFAWFKVVTCCSYNF